MKSKILFTLLVCGLLGSKLSAQCNANIDHFENVGSTQVAFWTDSVPTDSNSLGAYTYTWSFGDGTGGSGHQTTHQYAANTATYYVCLTKHDTLSGCLSTTCDSVYVFGNNCSVQLLYTNQDSLYTFTDTITGIAPYLYSWTVNGLFTGTSSTTSVSGVLPDSPTTTLSVCLLVTDASGCQAFNCVHLSDSSNGGNGGTPCSAAVSYTMQDSLYTFIATTGGTAPFTYSWTDNGQTLASTVSTAAFVVSNAYHTVCVTITDSTGCIASACTGVDDTLYGPICGTTISYSIFDSLYTFTTSNTGTAPFTYSWTIDGVPTGNSATSSLSTVVDTVDEAICVIVTDAHGCVSTDCSHPIDSAALGSCHAYFQIVADTLSADTGTYYGYNYSTGSYGSNIIWSFGDGSTSTDPYPSHTYAQSGIYILCLTVGTPGTSCYDSYCDSSFYVSRSLLTMKQIVIMSPSGVQTVSSNAAMQVYPNPVSNELNIMTSDKIDQERIFNIEGQMVFESNINTTKIEVSKLNSGIYILELTSMGSVSRTKFVKD